MLRKYSLYTLLVLTLFSVNLVAQTGKIFGKVTDDKGEPLIQASVQILGTTLGAATNLKGEFIILNVPPGVYSLKASYVGYADETIKNVRVSAALTTQVDFVLQPKDVMLKEIVKTAEKPLINKNITNSTNVVGKEDIELLPVRGVNTVVGLQAGVVTQGGNLYVRGSRMDAVAYYVDGVLVNNPVFGGSRAGVITNAIEEIQFQAGGYSAEFSGANGGIISTQTRIGSEKYSLSFEGITDYFAPLGEKFLGTYSRNYTELVFTASGPLLPSFTKLKFFLAASSTFSRTPSAFYKGVDFKGLTDPAAGSAADTFDLYYPEGYLVSAPQHTVQVQGNLFYDLNPLSLRLNGNYVYSAGKNGVDYFTYNSRDRAGINESRTLTSSLKATYVISPFSFFDLIVNYFGDFYVDMDPVFKHNIAAYGDSLENAAKGYQLKGDGQTINDLYAFGYQFDRVPNPYNLYRKQKTQSFGGKFNLTYQLGSHHEFKVGGELTRFTIRRYSLAPVSLASLAKSVANGSINKIYNRLDNYGYDVYGNETDEGLDKAKHPVFAGAYIQDKIEYSDLVINVGLRYDYIDINGQQFVDPTNIKFAQGDIVDPASLKDVPVYQDVSPRLGFSFPVTDRTVFHAQYGKFVQQSRLRDVYQGYNVISDNIKGGYAISQPVGFGLKPEVTTQYEIGFKQQVGDIFSFDITGFYKDIKDQIQIRTIYAASTANHQAYYAFVNGDFSTVKGIEFKLDLRRVQRISATFDLTYSDAQGTGSNPSSGFRQIWQSPTADPFFPMQIAPLDFNQTFKGALNVDYRFGKDDGPTLLGSKVLSELGATLLFQFGSGFNFTKWEGYGNARTPLEPLNASTTPWTFQLDLRLDKNFDFGFMGMNVYLWVINVLNTKNVVGVFNNTGDPYNDGYLTSQEGKQQVESYRTAFGDKAAELYKQLYTAMSYNSGNFGTPRQIRLGIRLNY